MLRAKGTGKVQYPSEMVRSALQLNKKILSLHKHRLRDRDTWTVRSQPNQIHFEADGSIEDLEDYGENCVKMITELA